MSGGSVAGVFGLVQTYRQAKLDSDYKLMSMMNEIADASYDKVHLSNMFAERRAALSEEYEDKKEKGECSCYSDAAFTDYQIDDDTVMNGTHSYDEILKELDELKELELAKVAAEEQEWQSKYQKEQTHNLMLQTNIQNYEAMLKGSIEGNFTYGYQ